MSKEDEVNLRVVAAMVQAACYLLEVKREVWLGRRCFADPVMWMHLCAMNAAAVRLGVPMSARREVLLWSGVVNLGRTPFERGMVEFYVDRGRQVISGQCAVISGKAGEFQKH